MTGMVIASPSMASEVIHQFDLGAEPYSPARDVLDGRSFVVKKDATD